MPYLFMFREILNLTKEFGRSLPGKHLIPRYFNIDRYARQKYGLISMCILSFDTNTINNNRVVEGLQIFQLIIQIEQILLDMKITDSLKAQVSLQFGKVFSSDNGVPVSIMYSYMY